MSRKPFRVPKDTQGTNCFRKYNRHSTLDTIFNKDIFPDGSAAFTRADLQPDLYLSKRQWREYVEWGEETDADRHESYLHSTRPADHVLD